MISANWAEALLNELMRERDDARAEVRRLRAEVERLRALVEIAYQEGWEDGRELNGTLCEDWRNSLTREALEVRND